MSILISCLFVCLFVCFFGFCWICSRRRSGDGQRRGQAGDSAGRRQLGAAHRRQHRPDVQRRGAHRRAQLQPHHRSALARTRRQRSAQRRQVPSRSASLPLPFLLFHLIVFFLPKTEFYRCLGRPRTGCFADFKIRFLTEIMRCY